MARSVRKGPFADHHLIEKIEAALKDGGRRVVKTWSRRSTILPNFVGSNVMVHNGHKFIPLFITENMVGHKLGEFAPTRTFRGHSGDRKGKK
ncbi:MAG TPA: 30S ribosomal protein S19 [Nannocystaceae bacterium]|nr:30S ribosomal protein S19 [Nannocystaceae bacterium]